jgi:hypothetical protein
MMDLSSGGARSVMVLCFLETSDITMKPPGTTTP